MITPIETRTNANNVPTFTISSSTTIFEQPATTATTTPTPTVIRTGTPVFSFTAAMFRGSKPSRLIAKITRLCPSIRTSTPGVRPARAPTAMILAAQLTPLRANALANVAVSPPFVAFARSLYLTMPVSATVTRTYNTVTMASDPKIPRGRSLAGFLVSSAAVATMSNPMKAKNTRDAAASTPNTPKLDGATPVTNCHSGCSSGGLSVADAGAAGGVNGERLAALKEKK